MKSVGSVVLISKSVKLERKCVKLSVPKDHLRGILSYKIFLENYVIFFQKFYLILFNTSLPIQYKNLKEFEFRNFESCHNFKICLVLSDIDS